MRLEIIPSILAFTAAIFMSEPPRILPKENYLEGVRQGLKTISSQKPLWMLGVNAWFITFFGLCAIWLYQPALDSFAVPRLYFGYIHAIFAAVEILLMLIVMPRLRGLGGYLVISMILPALGYLVMGFAQVPLVVAIGGITIIGFGMSRDPLFTRLFNDCISDDSLRATTLSSMSALGCLGQAIVNLVVGYFAARSLFTTFVVVGFLMLSFSAVWTVAYRNVKKGG